MSYTAVVVSLPLQAEKKEEHFKTEPMVERVAQKKKQTFSFPSFAREGLRAWEDGSISILNLSRKALKQ